ncbi:MAG: hypothetical protein Q9163_003263 [Psora crenata]
MAPIATPILPSTAQSDVVPVKKGAGDYKEQAGGAKEFNRNLEEIGSATQPAAKVVISDAVGEDRELNDVLQYQNYLPTWNPDEKYEPLQPFTHVEHGLEADKSFPELLGSGVKAEDITPLLGTEISGIQLSQLSDAGKAQLALLAAQRKVLVFRDQDFADLSIPDALKYGEYFGRHHIHPTSGAPKNHPEIHLVHRGIDDRSHELLLESRLSTVAWHSDVTYEKQPPGTTFLYILNKPETGGDTLFVNQAEAYRRLSPGFRERLHGLKAVHSGYEQAASALSKGSIVRRDPVSSIHPLVRTHPTTGEKALFVNPQCKFARSFYIWTPWVVDDRTLQLPATSSDTRRRRAMRY